MTDLRGTRDQRPSPEALLEAARREESRAGKLKIFVGAAPGVGKTYEMLQSAHARRRDGYDVVVGVVETHGRRETEALLEGLEVLPRRPVAYKGRSLDEMDLDGVLARRPQIVLVDELAHTNAPGSRHPKRYLDVEEILNAGIDVYSTVTSRASTMWSHRSPGCACARRCPIPCSIAPTRSSWSTSRLRT
jgi:two-component system, OmpR family, sensor histidine kinase KdpD